MLNIYVGLDKVPKDATIVFDNEIGFLHTVLEDTREVRSILKNVEHAKYLSTSSFIDRFGYKLCSKLLSTGAKTLLNINYQTDKVFYGGGLGWNALQELLRLKQGNVFFDDGFEMFLQPEEGPETVKVNGIVCNNVLEMEEACYE